MRKEQFLRFHCESSQCLASVLLHVIKASAGNFEASRSSDTGSLHGNFYVDVKVVVAVRAIGVVNNQQSHFCTILDFQD